MDKITALDIVRDAWKDPDLTLYDKVMAVSTSIYGASLDIPGTAAYIDATPSELAALLALSELDEDDLQAVSKLNPPRTTWAMLAKGTPEEIRAALEALDGRKASLSYDGITPGECVYEAMVKVAPPSIEQKVATLMPGVIICVRKRGEQTGQLTAKEVSFMKSVASQRASGKVLTPKQAAWLKNIIDRLRGTGLLTRNGIGSDQELCNAALDALEP